MLEWLEKSLKKQNLSVSAEDYLKDLTESLCMITYEGHRYRFAHRSFQTYFAAKYTLTLSDQQQKEFLIDKFNWDSKTYRDKNYLDLLDQVDHERFLSNPIEPVFQDFISKYSSAQIFFQHILSYADIRIDFNSITTYDNLVMLILLHLADLLFYIHRSGIEFKIFSPQKSISTLLCKYFRKYSKFDCKILNTGIPLRDLLRSNNISENDKYILLNDTLDALQVREIYQAITDWLAAREAARQKPSSDDKFADY